MSSQSDEQRVQGRERLLLWHRVTPVGCSEADALALRTRVAQRLTQAGGADLVRAGTSVGASFDPLDLELAIDLALALLVDASAQAAHFEVACALGLGELLYDPDTGILAGTLIDRVQLLAASADGLQLVLDEAAQVRVKDTHLFTHTVMAGPVSGLALDVDYPRKRDCRSALAALRPAPLPSAARAGFEHLTQLARTPGALRLAISGPAPHAALDHIERLRQLLRPALMLHLGPQAAGLQPLGGLQLGLWRVREPMRASLDAALAALLARLANGAALGRDEAVVALRELLRRAAAGGGRAWVVIEQPHEIDRATLTVVEDALAGQDGDQLAFVITDQPDSPPASSLLAGGYERLAIEALGPRERAEVAAAVLGTEPDSELARRVGLLGGDTVLGVVEAARTLVGSGDLVLESGAFRWRTQPRNASLPIPIDALLTERAAGLEPASLRVLEALCVAPPAAPHDFVRRITLLDGLADDAAKSGWAQLRQEGWVDEQGTLGPLQALVRNALRNGMPPSRAAELHRFVAEVLGSETALARPSFGHALLAHHLAEGGREREAADALLTAAQATNEAGFARMAVRLAAVSLKLDSSPETRKRARSVAGTLELIPTPPSDSEKPSASRPPRSERESAPAPADPRRMASAAIHSAVEAILRGEPDAAEGLIDTAVAAGHGRAGAQRLWSVAQLSRGDIPEAVRSLKLAHVPGASQGTRSREAIAAALILSRSGETIDAVRSALDALQGARRTHDARGEQVALSVLEACYRVLGRDADAERIGACSHASVG